MTGFKAQLARGQIAEGKISRWLRGLGRQVMPVYETETGNYKGPRIFGPKYSELVAPDLAVFGGEKKFSFVEAKCKTHFGWYRKRSKWMTGIDRNHYEDYLEIRTSTGFPLWVLFLHESSAPSTDDLRDGSPASCPVGLFGAEVLAMSRMSYTESSKYEPNGGRHGMIYWEHGDLTKFATLEEIDEANQQGD